MRVNPNGSVAKASTANLVRVPVGVKEYNLYTNLQIAYKKVRVNQVAVLPSSDEYLRVRGGWKAVQ